MTVDLRVDKSSRVARVTIDGPVAVEGFIRGLEALVAHPEFVSGMDIVVDLGGHDHQATSADMRTLAQAFVEQSEHLRGTRLAAVVSRTVSYGMGRMLQTYLEDAPFRFCVFYDYREAEEWLRNS